MTRGVPTILVVDIGVCRPVPESVQGVDEMVRNLKATPKAEGAEFGVQ